MLRLFRHYIPIVQLAAIVGDAAVILGAIVATASTEVWLGQGLLWPKAFALAALTLLTLQLAELYRPTLVLNGASLTLRVGLACASASVLMAALGYALPPLRLGRGAFFQIFVFLTAGLLSWRAWWLRLRSQAWLHERVLILGSTATAKRILDLQTIGARPFRILGFLDDDPAAPEHLPPMVELLGKSRDLLSLVDELRPDVVLVTLTDMRGRFPKDDLLECRLRGIRVEDWPTFYEKQTGKVLVAELRPSWLIFADGFAHSSRAQAAKRIVDVTVATVFAIMTLPLMVVVALAVKLDSKGPVLFRQHRVGLRGRIFLLNKFRSMEADAERRSGAVWATKDDQRITRVGRWLRKSRLDELPQLFNVLRGDMSFIGPRPERPEFVRFLAQRIPFYRERLAVKPGLTGWAQVRHSYAASVEDTIEKLEYDLYYIKNVSLFLDLLILLATIQVVLFAKGAR